jgi:acyl carrier protein
VKPNWNGANIESELRGILAECCRRDLSQVGDDADLVRELGLDSLAMLRLLAEVEMRLEVRFPDSELTRLRTLRQFAAAIRSGGGDLLPGDSSGPSTALPEGRTP